jgi:hypothetical protein
MGRVKQDVIDRMNKAPIENAADALMAVFGMYRVGKGDKGDRGNSSDKIEDLRKE